MHPDDRAIVERLIARDERVFAELVTRLHPRLVAMALRILGNEASAEDAAQETWRRVTRALPTFEGRSRLSTWIFATLVNCAKTRRAGERQWAPIGTDEADPFEGRFVLGQWREPPQPWPSETDPESRLASKEMLGIVAQKLAELPDRQRLVVTLRDIEGWDPSATADVLGITEENQRVLLHRGRTTLRDLVDRALRSRPSNVGARRTSGVTATGARGSKAQPKGHTE